jgi:glycosyltransferase involved in cell wall biosynthesis
MHVIHFYPWGCFNPISCGADRSAVHQLEYFRERGWTVDLLVGWSARDATIVQQFRDHYSWTKQITFLDIPPVRSFNFEGLMAAYCQLKQSSVLARALLQPVDLFFANYYFTAPLLDLLPASCKRMLETHDLMTYQFLAQERQGQSANDRVADPLHQARARYLFQEEMNLFQFFDAVLMVQPEELEFVQSQQPLNLHYIPRLFPVRQRMMQAPGTKERFDLLFVGSDHPMNRDGLDWFYQRVYKPYLNQHGIRVGLVGRVCERITWEDPQIEKLGVLYGSGDVLQEMYEASKIVVVPILEGTGVSMKTLEGLSMGRPLISTPAGIRGLLNAEQALVCQDMQSDPAEFASRILDLLASPGKRRALEKAALAYMQEHHSREANFAAMDEAIQSMEIDPSRN